MSPPLSSFPRSGGSAPDRCNVETGANVFSVAATDASGNARTQSYQVNVSGSNRTLTYDANGNLLSDGQRTFEWDALNQLIAVNSGTHRSEFTYDGLQRRVRIIEKESSTIQSDTHLIWCESAICEERAADGVTVTRRAFAQGDDIAGVAHFFATDHLGSVREVTDSSSTLLARYAFDPWGRRSLIAGTETTTVGFTGHRWQVAGTLSLAQYRGYDPELAAWVSDDPASLGGGFNLRRYAVNNPVRYRDGDGRNPVAGAIAGAEAGSLGGPAGAVAGGVIGAIAGLVIGIWMVDEINKARQNAATDAQTQSARNARRAICARDSERYSRASKEAG